MFDPMQFNIYFNICALIIMVVVAWRFFTQRQFPTITTYVYTALILMGGAAITTDTMSSLIMESLDIFPLWSFYFVNSLYYICQVALPAALAFYVLAWIQPSAQLSRNYYLFIGLPLCIFELILLIGIPSNLIFSLDSSGVYSRTPLAYVTYISGALYVSITVALCVRYRSFIPDELIHGSIIFLPFLVAAMALQYLIPSLLLTGMALAVGFIVMSMTFQDPARMTDVGTSLFNRSAFETLVSARLSNGIKTYLVVFEFDDIRRISQQYGNQAKDAVLLDIATSFLGRGRWVFRLGDNRFGIITRSEDAFGKALEQVRQSGNVAWNIPDGTTTLSVNGVYSEDMHLYGTVDVLKNVTEQVLLRQRQSGSKNQLIEIDNSTLLSIKRADSIELAIRDSLNRGTDFSLYYQPIYNMKHKRYESAEGLVRYTHPELGFLPPSEFMNVIEEKGLSTRLDEFVVKRTLADIQNGLFDNLGFSHVHINLTGASLESSYITSHIPTWVDESGVDPHFLCFEILESNAIRLDKQLETFFAVLTQKGCMFAMDDFGTGYSNIVRLISMPVSIVKLDRAIILSDPMIYETLVNMLQSMDKQLVAEGVETDSQNQFVRKLGVDCVQGFYYAHAMPRFEFRRFITESIAKSASDSAPNITVQVHGNSPLRVEGSQA